MQDPTSDRILHYFNKVNFHFKAFFYNANSQIANWDELRFVYMDNFHLACTPGLFQIILRCLLSFVFRLPSG